MTSVQDSQEAGRALASRHCAQGRSCSLIPQSPLYACPEKKPILVTRELSYREEGARETESHWSGFHPKLADASSKTHASHGATLLLSP